MKASRRFIQSRFEICVCLNDIRSNHNVGSIFRTSDACAVSKIFLVGFTPTPVNQFGIQNKEIAKTALGAESTIDWISAPNIKTAISVFRGECVRDGVRGVVLALEQSSHSKNIFDYRSVLETNQSAPVRILLVLGNEVGGLSRVELKLVDAVVDIPMFGRKESLNVSVAAGIALYVFRL